MTDNFRKIGERSADLAAALAVAHDPREVVFGLPDRVEGRVAFTVVARDFSDGTQSWDLDFAWDGASDATPFWFDISGLEDISPGSSSPIVGWVAWTDRANLSIAFAHPELESHGVAWLTEGAPRQGEAASEWAAADWAELARRVIDAVIGVLAGDGGDGRLFYAAVGK